jgi:hypothetical protein
MAQLILTESFWSEIYRDEKTCNVYKEVKHKTTTTTDEAAGEVVGQTDEIIATIEAPLVVAPR